MRTDYVESHNKMAGMMIASIEATIAQKRAEIAQLERTAEELRKSASTEIALPHIDAARFEQDLGGTLIVDKPEFTMRNEPEQGGVNTRIDGHAPATAE